MVPPAGFEAFILSRQVMGCTRATLAFYRETLGRSAASLTSLDTCNLVSLQGYLTKLRESGLAQVSLHRHFRALRCFFRWAADAGLVSEDPMRGLPRDI